MDGLNIVIFAFAFACMFTGFLVGYCIGFEDGEKKNGGDS